MKEAVSSGERELHKKTTETTPTTIYASPFSQNYYTHSPKVMVKYTDAEG
jgi:hypothetical protein